jgi:hypothetical protein
MTPGSFTSGATAARVLIAVADVTYFVNTKSGLNWLQRGKRGLGQLWCHVVDLTQSASQYAPKNPNRGHATVEFALMAPWIVFLFIGILDFGFYSYAALSVENAARVAALYTANNGPGAVTDSAGACYYVLEELQNAGNMGSGVNSCGGQSPVTVTAAAATVGGQPASQVSVTYKALPMIPIPGMLRGTFSFTRIVAARQ